MKTTIDLSDEYLEDFEYQLEKVVKRLNRKIQEIIDDYVIISGIFEVSAENIDKALVVQSNLMKALEDSGYYSLATKTLKNLDKLLELRSTELKGLLDRERLGGVTDITLESLQKLKYSGMEGLAERQILAIKESLYNSVTLGLPKNQLRVELEKKLGTLSEYAKTYMRTSYREYAQTYENIVADKIGFGLRKDDIWEYMPPVLQDNSHLECIYAVKKQYFTNAEKIDFENGGLSLTYPHSEPRWNCVHRFQITNVTFKEAFK